MNEGNGIGRSDGPRAGRRGLFTIVLAAALSGSVAGGGAAFVWLRSVAAPPGEGPGARANDGTGVRALAEQLAEERIARERLEADVALLRSALELQARGERARRLADTRAGDIEGAPGTGEEALRSRVDEAASSSTFDTERLVALGSSESDAEWLRSEWEGRELEKLYLADRAAREGWLFTPRYGQENAKLDTEMRGDVGDDGYEKMLFAAGLPNRVVVGGVLGGSVANDVGLQKNDQILSYGDRRIFAPLELREATRGGESGELVPIEILRDGEREKLWVPRGPLGAMIQHEKHEPL